MFYSHHLLSKKHPMGQIWIAATIRANINRSRAAKINIEQICKQILNPPVPLALRLSGILMGGIVHIYNRKVCFLYEDLNAFLMKIKIEAARDAVKDRTTLPKRKYHAKYENITMDDGFQISDQSIERCRRASSVPLQEATNTTEEMFFVFPDAVNINIEDHSSPRDHFQAAIEDITLQDYSPEDLDGLRKSVSSISVDSILGATDDHLPEFQLPRMRPYPNNNLCEDHVLDSVNPDNRPPDLSGALHTIFEEQLPEPDINRNSIDLAEEGSSKPTRERRQRKRKRNVRALIYDGTTTEIPKKMFTLWLNDRSDIVDRSTLNQVEKTNKKLAAAVLRNWTLPSVCVSLKLKSGPEPVWAPALQKMWSLAISAPSTADLGEKSAHSGPSTQRASLPSSDSKQNSPMEIDFPQETAFTMENDFRTGVEISPLTDQPSLGSVEKLRAALQTPSTGSQEEFIGNKFGLRTPGLFAPLTTDGKSSKRSMPTSQTGTGSLSYDSEGELPTSGKSKRSRSSAQGIRSMSPAVSGELPELDFLPRRASGKSDMIDYFASGDFQSGILAQSQLLEDTSGSTQVPVPADSISTTTIILAKLLREHFNKLQVADVFEASMNKLTSGLDKTRAARMFYQVCVLASNESIYVSQAEPYGDILLKRGVTL
ncbi:sister chromatid cohesion 1 protein 1 [Physcomitrium patens]|uniref:Rad21/Rec8-like protein N-terminal domain-containing protein n=1 Tax=Physcomitrium patens TaxID=3218 RepID=A0A2K1KW71_PHYPA|nr:sister chromatid cohesion 1 protein 1-like [Physcomitrium patens]XP_024370678.1 sister chromatid cohesion 1 protein 1-like [Physcomitrium patens]XP_024370679.1 sister chromatid cohesion 1 protein 1-like [Physcomitrium patens]XP_024370680.1 sister chromatid cohesion 1 protein 1-like [Physcomitrium patens]XP_024370681.1 sister chromatid cohesion 1 protein 1-like [Physcomitrium patens]XP_024370682.1 sister chromatid cohesion 1 protein 1-like [Physcomitrium patens]PNR58019.1 hypothetical prote|eukprot:XP_024370677.1 sister chromatid cohesion 1 protein 1-like [Physcomitrella patens]